MYRFMAIVLMMNSALVWTALFDCQTYHDYRHMSECYLLNGVTESG